MLEELTVSRVQFVLKVTSPIAFPRFPGFAWRGAFGTVFRRLVCAQPRLSGCQDCFLKANCAYCVAFNPVNPDNSPYFTKNDQLTRPFLFFLQEDRAQYEAGEEMNLLLTLVGRAVGYFPYFFLVLSELGELGVGKRDEQGARGTYRIKGVTELTGSGSRVLYPAGVRESFLPPQPQSLSSLVSPFAPAPTGALRVQYLTPLRVKWQKKLCREIPFHVLFRNVLRRLSGLYFFSLQEPWRLDYRGWIERAQTVETADASLSWVEFSRYSTRQQEKMILGGVTGWADYRGPALEACHPFLQAAEVLAVGKGTSFGFGQIRLETSEKGG